MGKRGSSDDGAEGRAKKARKAKRVGISTVLRPVLIGAALLAVLGAVLPKVI